jgi:C4-dicarboxylate-specific signal transduction histidine kinase
VAKWRESLAAGQPFEAVVRHRHAADGEYRWFLENTVLFRDERGNILKWYGTSTEIEDHKRAEEALREAQAELAHVNCVATKDKLTTSIAHEVKQPIAATAVKADAAMRWLTTRPPNVKNALQALDRIAKDSARAGDVIERMRAMLKRAPQRKDRLEINELILKVMALTRSEAAKNGVSARTELG